MKTAVTRYESTLLMPVDRAFDVSLVVFPLNVED